MENTIDQNAERHKQWMLLNDPVYNNLIAKQLHIWNHSTVHYIIFPKEVIKDRLTNKQIDLINIQGPIKFELTGEAKEYFNLLQKKKEELIQYFNK